MGGFCPGGYCPDTVYYHVHSNCDLLHKIKVILLTYISMYKNINIDLVVMYFYVCVIFKVISRSNRCQIIEKWAFSE